MVFDVKIKAKVNDNLIEIDVRDIQDEVELKEAKKTMLFMTSVLAKDLTKKLKSINSSSEDQKPQEEAIMSSEGHCEVTYEPVQSAQPVNMMTKKQFDYLCRLGYTGVDMDHTTAEEASNLIKIARAEQSIKKK